MYMWLASESRLFTRNVQVPEPPSNWFKSHPGGGLPACKPSYVIDIAHLHGSDLV